MTDFASKGSGLSGEPSDLTDLRPSGSQLPTLTARLSGLVCRAGDFFYSGTVKGPLFADFVSRTSICGPIVGLPA
jgi:hypothetical protein